MPLRMAQRTLPATQPVSLKSLSVDGAGRLSRRPVVGPLVFSFSHDGRTYHCRFTERGGRAVLAVDLTLGRLDGLPPERRRVLRRIVRAARADGISLILRRDGRIDLSQRLRPTPPVAGHTLVGALVRTVLVTTPWLDLMAAYLGETAGRPGS